MDVIEDLSIVVIANLELPDHPVMNDVDLDVACGKKIKLLTRNMVEGFRGVIDMDLHDVVISDMDLNLYVVSKVLKDMEVITNVDFDDAADLHVAGRMNIYSYENG